MNIRAILKRLTGSKKSHRANGCPGEAAILAYTEGKVSESDRATLQTHLAKCDDCRELLVDATLTDDARNVVPVSDKEVKQQAARVLAYIELDEAKRRGPKEATKRAEPARSGLYLSYPRLASAALVVSAVAAGTVMWITSDHRSDAEAMATLRQAMKDERRTQALISGDLPNSRYSPKRGEEESDDLNYERALNRVRSAESETAPAEARHTLARILLAMGGRENVRKALTILDQIEASGVQSPELLNDLGVARLQLRDYTAATNYFTRALQESPGAGVSLFNRALAQQRAGLGEEARQDWNQFISTSSDEGLKAEARSQLDMLR